MSLSAGPKIDSRAVNTRSFPQSVQESAEINVKIDHDFICPHTTGRYITYITKKVSLNKLDSEAQPTFLLSRGP